MRKKGTKFFALIGMSGFSLAAATIASVAWFISTIKITDINGTGFTDAAYFAYGSGTVNDPFGISEVRHLSNLTWLQYNGQFDDKPYYFELANDINENGAEYVMPPIGTESHPFIGVFDGNGHTVYNIKVTNDYSQFSKKPHNITYNQADAEVIGFFGVVGNLDGESYSSQTNSLHDVTLENLTVESKTSNTLIGLAAGYINADMSGVKVGTSTIKTNGNAAKTAYTDKLSDYGLVGYTTKTGSSGTFEQRISQYYNSKSQGDDPGWGGSIVIKDLYNRLTNIRSNYAVQNQTVGLSYDDAYDADSNELISHTIHKHTSGNNQYEMSATLDVYNEDTRKNNATYNSKIGAVQLSYDSNSNGGIYYLSGGHYSTKNYYNFNEHEGTKISDKNGHYFSVASFTSGSSDNAGSFTSTDVDNATIWNVPTDAPDYISTTYCYNDGSPVTYYLYVSNNTLLYLSADSSKKTTFTREEDSDGYVRYNAGNYYLAYMAGEWSLTPIPTAPNPTTPDSYFSNSYQIYYGNSYLCLGNNSMTSVASGLNASTNPGWRFEYNNGSGWSSNYVDVTLANAPGKSIYIYTTIGSQRYYLVDNATSPYTVKYVTSRNSASTFSISQVNGGYNITYSSFIMCYNAINNTYADYSPSTVDENQMYSTLSISSTQTLLNDYQTAIANSFNCNPASSTSAQGPDKVFDHAGSSGMDYSSYQDATYLPLNVETNYEAKNTNTGYIVGGSYFSSSGSYSSSSDASSAYGYYGYGNVRIASFYTISDNLKNYSTRNKQFNANSVWTYDSTGLHKINDSSNTFVKYAESKGKVEQTLSEGSTIYGLHFMTAPINKDYAVKARYANINGTEYSDYMMPANSIDFNLKEQGYVNFFAAPYGNDSNGNARTVDSFFSLHMIKRNGTQIDNIYEIEEVFSDSTYGHSYVYRLSNGMYTIPYSIDKYNPQKLYVLNTKYLITDTEHGGYADGMYHQITQQAFTNNYPNYQSVFNMDWLKNHSYSNNQDGFHEAFYFEIPTNPGEYALGTVANKTFGAYLMYLDIAANAANKDQITAYAITTFQSGLKYPSGVDFNTTDVSGTVGGETFAIIISAGVTSDGDIDFTVSGATISYSGDFETQYAYSEKPASGASPPTAATLPPSTGTRVIYTHILTTDYQEWDIVVTDILNAQGEATSSSITSVRCDGDNVTVDDIPDSFIINSIRPQVSSYIATFTRLSGTNEFVMIPTYSGEEYKTLALTIDMNGTTLSVSNIATGYTLTINGTPVNNGTTYPAS